MDVAEIKRRLAITGTPCRAIWRGDDRVLRVGRSGDVCQMIENLERGQMVRVMTAS